MRVWSSGEEGCHSMFTKFAAGSLASGVTRTGPSEARSFRTIDEPAVPGKELREDALNYPQAWRNVSPIRCASVRQETGLHSDRVACGHLDHRLARRTDFAGFIVGPRSRSKIPLPEQLAADRHSDAHVP